MGREVRRVPATWEHPKDPFGRFLPLYDGNKYKANVEEFMGKLAESGLQAAIDWSGVPDKNDYMPDWPDEDKTHFIMYEDTSEGTPISPPMETPELLATWLADNAASAFGGRTATYDEWLSMINRGWAPSMVIDSGGLTSGVSGL